MRRTTYYFLPVSFLILSPLYFSYVLTRVHSNSQILSTQIIAIENLTRRSSNFAGLDFVKLRSKLFLRQKRWCTAVVSWEGYIMQDVSGCFRAEDSIVVFDEDGLHSVRYDLSVQKLLENKVVYVVGDSVSRYMFDALQSIVHNTTPTFCWGKSQYHNELHIKVGLNTTLRWKWAPRVWQAREFLHTNATLLRQGDHVLIMLGYHEVIYNKGGKFDAATEFAGELRKVYFPVLKDLTFQTASPVGFSGMYGNETPGIPQDYAKMYPHVSLPVIHEYNLHLAAQLNQPTHPIPTLDGLWRFNSPDRADGMLHSRYHALLSAYRYLWKIFWSQDLA